MSRDSDFVCLLTRPHMTVSGGPSVQNGPCQSTSTYRVESHLRLTPEKLQHLFAAGVLGVGQEFRVLSQCDGKEEAAFLVEVPCVEIDRRTGKRITPEGQVPINPYSGKSCGTHSYPFFVYECSTYCDSGD